MTEAQQIIDLLKTISAQLTTLTHAVQGTGGVARVVGHIGGHGGRGGSGSPPNAGGGGYTLVSSEGGHGVKE